jgi:hypothetical protein
MLAKNQKIISSCIKLINRARLQKDSNLSGQIWKAAGSAMDNIAE